MMMYFIVFPTATFGYPRWLKRTSFVLYAVNLVKNQTYLAMLSIVIACTLLYQDADMKGPGTCHDLSGVYEVYEERSHSFHPHFLYVVV